MKKRKVSAAAKRRVEEVAMSILRREFHRAMESGKQFNITIDPWLYGYGAYIVSAPNASGRTWEVSDEGWSKK